MKKIFPINPWPNLNPDMPSKRNKKQVSEDFVHYNLTADGWNVHEAFQDIGIDRVITRSINGKKCVRFLQIKTRNLEEEKYVKYTLKSKDFPTEPRTVFLIYSDNTSDFLIFLINDYLKLHLQNDKTTNFTSPSFKFGNNKIAPFKINCGKNKNVDGKWYMGNQSIDQYVNQRGIDKIKCTRLDEDIEFRNQQINELKDFRRDYFFKFKYQNPAKTTNKMTVEEVRMINTNIENLLCLNPTELNQTFKKNNDLISQQPAEIIQSWRKLRMISDDPVEGDS